MKPSSFRTSMARDRYTPGLNPAEVAQRGTKPMASHQSSLTSLEESGPSGLLPRKALLRAGGPHTEVSVLVHWPEGLLVSKLSLPFALTGPFVISPFLHDTIPVAAAVACPPVSIWAQCHLQPCPLLVASFQSCGSYPYVTVCQSWGLVPNCAICTSKW